MIDDDFFDVAAADEEEEKLVAATRMQSLRMLERSSTMTLA